MLSAMECIMRSTLCRLCLCCDDSASYIFQDNAPDQYVIASLLRELLQFHVSENDGYPKLICSSCVKTLIDFKKFKVDCLEAMTTYDTEIRLHESRIIHQQHQDEEICPPGYSVSIINEENNADNLDAYGNPLTVVKNNEDTFIEDKLVEEVPIEIEDKKDSFIEDNLIEEVPMEIVENAVKMEPAESIVNEDATLECPVPGADYESNGNEDILDVSSLVKLEIINEAEERVSMHEGYEDKNLNSHVWKDEIQESGNIKSYNVVTLNMLSFQNPTLRNSFESVSMMSVEKTRKNLRRNSKRFTCDICGRVTTSKQSIAYHVRIHSGERPHRCKVCNKSFGNKRDLKRHEAIHSGIRPFVCKSCPKTFARRLNLVRHEKRHLSDRGYPCDLCDMSCVTKSDLKTHQLCHKKEWQFFCSECGKGFITKGNLNVHLLSHKKERKFFCNECGKGFITKGNLQSHQIHHKGERNFICTECGKDYVTKNNLKEHMVVHSGLKPFTCDVCNNSFSRSSDLKRHSVTHMKVKPFICSICKRCFPRSCELKNHKCIDNNEIVYPCSKCSSKFTGIKSLRSHETHCKKRQK